MKKALILSTVILLVLGALLYFVKTRLDPPFSIMPERQYEEKAQSYIDEINPKSTIKELNAQFYKAAHIINYMGDSLLLESDVTDNLKEKLCEQYVPAYTNKCLEYFKGNSIWDSTEINNIRKQVGSVKQLLNSKGNRVVDNGSALNDKLDGVFNVTQRNSEALGLIKRNRFQDMASSEKTMERVKVLQNDDYLKYNTSLCDSLGTIGGKLEKAHFKSLIERVLELRDYEYFSKEGFEKKFNKVIGDIEDYRKKSQAVYGTSHDQDEISRLVDYAYRYRNMAFSHYEEDDY